jgi:tetratricopeptide (TPR) repeat protein
MNHTEKPFEYYKKLWEERFNEGKIPETMEIISEAGKFYPERYESIYSLIDCCKEGLKLHPETIELYYLLAMCFLRLGKWDSPAIVARYVRNS